MDREEEEAKGHLPFAHHKWRNLFYRKFNQYYKHIVFMLIGFITAMWYFENAQKIQLKYSICLVCIFAQKYYRSYLN